MTTIQILNSPVVRRTCQLNLAGEYERPEIYDGKTLPNEEPSEWYAFRLEIAEAPMNSADETEDSAEWISLPIVKSEADRIANLHNEGCIEDCVYFDFESSIPQITSEMFGDMQDFDKLNALAQHMVCMSPEDQIKFKAVLTAEQPQNINDVLDISEWLGDYELSYYADDEGAFFKEYLKHFMDTRLDSEWLDTLFTRNEGERLLKCLGASSTPYGVISARGHSLYEPVACHDPEVKELKTQALTDEKLDVIEVLGRKALFSNGRILPEEIPEGLYAYDLRYSDEKGQFISIEPKVGVNHGGTVLMRELLDFREKGYLSFTRIHSMVQKYEAGKEFPELLIGNYDLYEREKEKPVQMTLFDIEGELKPGEIEKILKECIISCKIKR